VAIDKEERAIDERSEPGQESVQDHCQDHYLPWSPSTKHNTEGLDESSTTHVYLTQARCHDFDISAAMTTLISDPQGPPTTSYDLVATLED